MNPISFIICMAGGFLLSLTDIVATFVVIRLLVTRWPTKWLMAFDCAGRPLIDEIYTALDHFAVSRFGSRLREGAKPLLVIFGLLLVRLVLQGLVGVLITGLGATWKR